MPCRPLLPDLFLFFSFYVGWLWLFECLRSRGAERQTIRGRRMVGWHQAGLLGSRAELISIPPGVLSCVHMMQRETPNGLDLPQGNIVPAATNRKSRLTEEFCRRLGPGLHVELLVDMLQMRAHRAHGNFELVADLLVKITFHQQGQDFLLARS